MTFLQIGESWGTKHQGAVVGSLRVKNVRLSKSINSFDELRLQTESDLRAKFSTREMLAETPIIQHYRNYYKQYKKSYHVLFQLESIAIKGKSIPNFNPLVTAMFIAELKNMLLTAGHDLDRVAQPVTLNLAEGNEQYTTLSGAEKKLKAGDMFTSDQEGILSSIIYGPDARTKISKSTQNLLFIVYAPPRIGQDPVRQHLQNIAENLTLIAPKSEASPIECLLAQ